MSQAIDYAAVALQDICGEDTEGAEISVSGVVIPMVIPTADIAGLLASYDSANQYSPNASDSRVLARLILDALKKKTEE